MQKLAISFRHHYIAFTSALEFTLGLGVHEVGCALPVHRLTISQFEVELLLNLWCRIDLWLIVRHDIHLLRLGRLHCLSQHLYVWLCRCPAFKVVAYLRCVLTR